MQRAAEAAAAAAALAAAVAAHDGGGKRSAAAQRGRRSFRFFCSELFPARAIQIQVGTLEGVAFDIGIN